ncbi:MAG: hypothetical protein JO340_06655 [Acidobacteriaceae bacterium]|nr:hypothetical protein [Acidobacteriaceae bacterium]
MNGQLQTIAWGAKVSSDFKARVLDLCDNLGMEADYLMSAMAFESGETFSASIRNQASGATGLIQFMPSTAVHMGTTIDELAAMTPVAQLEYVEKYFQPYRNRLQTLEDHYMAILWPAAIGKQDSFVLFAEPSKAYQQNAGLDADKDGKVTKYEAAAKVRAKYEIGKTPDFVG